MAEFDTLVALALDAQRIDARHLRWSLPADPVVAAQVADLAVRESQCCSFFAFSLHVSRDSLALEVSVPPSQESVLDGLMGRGAVQHPE